MNTEQFCYWLQGFIEIVSPRGLSEIQTQIVKDHLQLVFNKLTPSRELTGEEEPVILPYDAFPSC